MFSFQARPVHVFVCIESYYPVLCRDRNHRYNKDRNHLKSSAVINLLNTLFLSEASTAYLLSYIFIPICSSKNYVIEYSAKDLRLKAPVYLSLDLLFIQNGLIRDKTLSSCSFRKSMCFVTDV